MITLVVYVKIYSGNTYIENVEEKKKKKKVLKFNFYNETRNGGAKGRKKTNCTNLWATKSLIKCRTMYSY